MNFDSTRRRSLAAIAIVCACLCAIASGRATAGQTKRLDPGSKAQSARDALLTNAKQANDWVAHLAVDTQKPFSADGKASDITNSIPAFAEAAKTYQRAVADVEAVRNRETATLLRKYVSALDDVIKQLKQKDRIADAKTVEAERDRAAAEREALVAKVLASPSTNTSLSASQKH